MTAGTFPGSKAFPEFAALCTFLAVVVSPVTATTCPKRLARVGNEKDGGSEKLGQAVEQVEVRFICD